MLTLNFVNSVTSQFLNASSTLYLSARYGWFWLYCGQFDHDSIWQSSQVIPVIFIGFNHYWSVWKSWYLRLGFCECSNSWLVRQGWMRESRSFTWSWWWWMDADVRKSTCVFLDVIDDWSFRMIGNSYPAEVLGYKVRARGLAFLGNSHTHLGGLSLVCTSLIYWCFC